MLLYHGSKKGLEGPIRPISRELCDFGRGFYMGTDSMQPMTLICNFPAPVLYMVEADLAGLRILEVGVDIEWAMLIAWHRGKMEPIRGTKLYKKYAEMREGYDMVVGHIANDRMFVVLDRFFSGEITDQALIHSLSALKLGKQYVALTQKACDQITILEAKAIGVDGREALRIVSEAHRREGVCKCQAKNTLPVIKQKDPRRGQRKSRGPIENRVFQ